MLTPTQKRQYEALAKLMRGPRVKIKGNAVTVGRNKLQLPPAMPTQSSQANIF